MFPALGAKRGLCGEGISMKSLRLTLLGGFHACAPAGGSIAIAGTKAALLLAYLALTPGKAHQRESLVRLLWSDRGESQGRGSLRQAVWALRLALKEIEPSPLIIEGETLALDPGAVETDVISFEQLLAEASPKALQSALSLYHGELLEGIRIRDPEFEGFLRAEMERLHELAVDGCTRLLEYQLRADGASDSAAATAKRLLSIDPLQEIAHRTLMEHYANKRQVGLALKQYQTCRDILQRELQVEPDEETERLFNRIRLIRPCAAGTVPPGNDAVKPYRGNGTLPPAHQEKPSIAVLPFVNLSGDPEQEYFSDGITEDIITALSRLRWFLVIARNSMFVYKGRALDAKQIGRELGVRYILEGSVRKSGNRIRVTAQLVDAVSGTSHWAQNYDRELTDIFELQDDITQSVTAAIEPKLVAAEAVRSQNRSPEDLGAWDLVMRALAHYGRMTTKESETAIKMLRQAVQQYPDYGPANSLLAFALLVSGHVGWIPESDDFHYAARLARRAAELDDEDPWAHLALGYVAFTKRQTDEAVRQYLRALDLNPNFATAYGYLGWAVVFDGQSEQARRYFQQALHMSPHDPLKAFFYSGTCVAHYYAGRYDEAIEWGRKAIRERPGFTAAQRILCASLAQAGRTEETRAAVARLREIQPNVTIEWIEQHVPYTARAMPRFLDGMRKAGIR
jgi:TolB-like protein/Tfp pilus assembly protein PilF